MQGKPTSTADKALIIAQIDALMADGVPLRRACKELEVNHNNYYRWKQEAAGLKAAQPAGVKGRPVKFVLTQEEMRATNPRVFMTDALHKELTVWARKHYRDRLSPDELRDPALLRESRAALDELTRILGLGSVYAFQKV